MGLRWLRSRDAGLSALRRAGRAAIVMPAMLALAEKVIGDVTLATFAAFVPDRHHRARPAPASDPLRMPLVRACAQLA